MKINQFVLYVGVGCSFLGATFSLSAENLPKYSLDNLEYEGAFRLPAGNFGDGRVAWSAGKIAVHELRGTIFYSGSNQKSVAEFRIPELERNASTISELPIADSPIQDFRRILDDADTGNPNGVNVITGLGLIDDKLIVNAGVYYDASASNFDTTLIIDDYENLADARIRGYMKLQGGNRAAGWVSEIPSEYNESLKGEFIFGHANNLPINGRSSIGPSAFSVEIEELRGVGSGEAIKSTDLLSFGINNPLHPDLENKTLDNDLWTELSRAAYGFIVPGTSTYLTIGHTGGLESGIGYKITQENGFQCGGFCAYDYKDYYNYILLWDVNDLIASAKGAVEPWSIRPYYYGKITLPFEKSEDGSYVQNLVAGATASSDGRLYVVFDKADKIQSEYEDQPVILVYSLNSNGSSSSSEAPKPPIDFKVTQ